MATVAFPIPEPGPRLRLPRLFAINALYFGHGAHWQSILVAMLPVGAALVAPNQGPLVTGRVTAAGAIFATLVPVAAGWLSDRTASPWERRTPWIVAGTFLNVLGLALLGVAGTFSVLIIAFLLVQASNNAAGAAYSAVIPDLIPQDQRGQASGLLGMLNQLGTVLGVAVVGLLFLGLGSTRSGLIAGYAAIAAIMIVTLTVTVSAIREKPVSPRVTWRLPRLDGTASVCALSFLLAVSLALVALLGLAGEATTAFFAVAVAAAAVAAITGARLQRLRAFLAPFKNRDFFWVFATRALVMLGINSIVPFIAFYFRDVIGLSNFGAASSFWLLAVIAGAVLPSVVGGLLSDRMGRRKLFVYLSSGLMALVVSVLLFTLIHSLPVMYVLGILFGIGYGAYYAVDFALVCDVLPDRERGAAKDIGLWHSALTIPQVLGPATMGPVLQSLNEPGHTVLGIATGGNLGYRVVFASVAVWFILGTVLVSRIRGVR